MDSATWCRTPAAASAARRLRPEVSKNSSTALSSNEGELARSITTCVPAMASLRPSPVMLLTPVLGEAATTSWPPWRRMETVSEPIRPVPPITTIFILDFSLLAQRAGLALDEGEKVEGRTELKILCSLVPGFLVDRPSQDRDAGSNPAGATKFSVAELATCGVSCRKDPNPFLRP